MKIKKEFLFALIAFLASAVGICASADYNKIPTSEQAGTVYRLYNPNTGEHFYTPSLNERNHLVPLGWENEGLGWTASATGDPVYRLFNPNAKGGDHYYTKSLNERNFLVEKGWKAEGVSWYSGGDTDVYVAYNPNAESGAHNYTTSTNEQNYLLANGWKYGSVAWKSISSPTGTGKLPEMKAGAAMTNAELDSVINKMRQLVVGQGDFRIGNRVTVFSRESYHVNGYAQNFKNGVFTEHDYTTSSGLNSVINDNDLRDPVDFMYKSDFAEFARGGDGYVTAILTSKGWYILPDYKIESTAPDYSEFIQTGNPSDLTNYIYGKNLVLEPTDLFGSPIPIS